MQAGIFYVQKGLHGFLCSEDDEWPSYNHNPLVAVMKEAPWKMPRVPGEQFKCLKIKVWAEEKSKPSGPSQVWKYTLLPMESSK